MSMRLHRRAAAFLLVLPLVAARPGHADAVRVVASDDRGVTLELSLPDYQLGPADEDGRRRLTATGLTAHTLPGRPVLPAGNVLVALPPGGRPVVGPVDGDAEEVRDGVRVWLGDKRAFADDPQGLGPVPTAERADPIRDGVWPRTPVELGVPFTLRGQRMVAVRIQPFRYDEAAARLWIHRRLRVRVDFGAAAASVRGAGPEDRHWDPVLRGAVINYEQGRAWRIAHPAATRSGARLFDRTPAPSARASTAAFDESDPEVRILLDSTGVYAIPYDALAAKGYPAGVPIAEVSLHRHEFLEDQIPAYETIELPIEIDEAQPANGIFDSGDRIVAYVQSWAERSGASIPQREWGDGEVVYATRVARGGLRVATRSGWLDATGLTPLPSYPWTQHWEKNLTYLQFPGNAPAETLFDDFHWTGVLTYYDRPEFQMEVNDIDPTHPVPLTAAWQGRKNGIPYWTSAQIRNQDYLYYDIVGAGGQTDSVTWSGKGNLVLNTVLPGDWLSEGGNNALVTWARNGSGPPHPVNNAYANLSFNWFEATYWRSYKAIKSTYLSCNSGDATGTYEILTTGFADTTTLRAYDVTNPLAPTRLTDVRREHPGPGTGNYALRFQDQTAGPRLSYLVFSQPKAVPAAKITPVTRRALAERGSGDYLLITPEVFLNAVQPLVTVRASEGLDVAVIPLESLFDEFNGGRRSSYAIKRFMRFALNNWNSRFAVLVGDGSEDPLNRLGNSGPDMIPVAKVPGPVGVADGRELISSDGWYVWCLNGCPPDGSGQPPPILPEIFLGRLPVTTVQEASDVVAKLVNYENVTPAQTWRNRILLFSDDEYSGVTTFGGNDPGSGYCHRFYEDRFHLLNQTIYSTITDVAGLKRSDLEHFQLGYWLRNEPVDAFDCRPDLIATQNRTRATVTPELISRLNNGRMWWNYQGHANEFVLAHENFYRNVGNEDDKDLLVNDDMPFLFSAFSCHVNAFGRTAERADGVGPTMGEELVVLPRHGAIATWASAGYEIIPDNGTDHINVAWARAMFVDPPHDDVLGNGDLGARAVLGETIALALMRYVPTVYFDPTENGIALSYTLLGDPATRLSIGQPQTIVTANGDTVVSNRPVALAPPRDTLHLEAELVSNVVINQIQLIEDGNAGPRVVPDTSYTLTPTFPDTAALGLGGRRYHLSFTSPLRPGVLRYTIHTRDRYGLTNDFVVLFQFFTQLLAGGNPLIDNDPVGPAAVLSLKVVLPSPISDPQTQLVLAVDSLAQAFTATSLDTTARDWLLNWIHPPYPGGTHRVELTALDSLKRVHHFRVVEGMTAENRLLRNVLAFPNPFDDQVGSAFSFYLLADGATDVMLRLFTLSGRAIYQRVEHGLSPGYHQWPWDGRDMEGDKLANGVYLYKMVATTAGRSDTFTGRLVKLRKPRRSDSTTP